ncbi:MAG: metalloregulator ArsR/SmtB family transcription factor [Caldilineaceae bacterium]|nr:metalloregulator ArsR/SmtB family transcription factor [Caldilineaceae bacterium]
MAPNNFHQLLQFFKVLGHESRLQIVGLLANGERSVGELAAALQLTEPTVSHHLAMMREVGLLGARAEGTTRIYWLDTGFLERMSKDIFSQENLAHLAPDEGAESSAEKIRQTFLEDGRIKEIPARRQKRLVVLQWLVNHFEREVRYPEAEMNVRLKQFHPDFAALRRYLIENGLMQREGGLYWRIDA